MFEMKKVNKPFADRKTLFSALRQFSVLFSKFIQQLSAMHDLNFPNKARALGKGYEPIVLGIYRINTKTKFS